MALTERIKTFFGEARQEIRHVNWPTRKEATRLTIIVIFLSIALAVFLGAFDFAFTYLLTIFV
jgi:preprotein translocase subunit SecE